MKVAFLWGRLDYKGGIETIWVDRANYLAEKYGHEVYFISIFQQPTDVDAYRLGDNVRHLKLGVEFLPTVSMRRNPVVFLYQWVKWRLAYKKAIRDAVVRIDPDVVFCTTYFDVGRAYKGYPLVVESHVTRAEEDLASYTSFINRRLRYRHKRILERDADVFVCLTHGDARNWDVKPQIIPNFTNITPKSPVCYAAKKVIAAGRICEQKGFDILIDAWKKVAAVHPDWHLDIYGGGKKHLVDALKEQIRENGLGGYITLCGVSNDMAKAYAAHSFFVFPSRWEGFGLVLLEAMACGLPVVSSDCDYGPRDIMCGDKTTTDCGILVPTGDANALADAINNMIEHPEERERMGMAAMRRAKCYDKDRIMAQWQELMLKL